MSSSFNPPGPSSAPKKIPDVLHDQANPQKPLKDHGASEQAARTPFATDDATPGAGGDAGGSRGVGSVGNSQKAHR